MTTERAQLEAEIRNQIGTADWQLLATHAKAGTLILVDESLELLTAAVAIASNSTDAVAPWVDSGLLTKPDTEIQESFSNNKNEFFQFVVVAPFVLAQHIKLAS